MSIPSDVKKVSSTPPVEHRHEQISNTASSQRGKMLPGPTVQSAATTFSASPLTTSAGNEELRTPTLEDVALLHNQLKSYKFRSEKRTLIYKIFKSNYFESLLKELSTQNDSELTNALLSFLIAILENIDISGNFS